MGQECFFSARVFALCDPPEGAELVAEHLALGKSGGETCFVESSCVYPP